METPVRKTYPSDLTDAQWVILEPLVPASKHGGRPRTVDMREIINTILYLNRTGCQWDMLPHDLLPKSTVYEYFAQWRDDGTWAKFVDALRVEVRTQEGREATPSAMCIDSQSVKTQPRRNFWVGSRPKTSRDWRSSSATTNITITGWKLGCRRNARTGASR